MANGVLGMTPKLGKRKAEVMTAVLHFWEPQLDSMGNQSQRCCPNTSTPFCQAQAGSPALS